MSIHTQIKCLIEASGRSMRDVAKSANIPYTRLHGALSNGSSMRFEDVASLSLTLGVSLDDLARTPPSVREQEAARRILSLALELGDTAKIYQPTIGLESFLDWWHAHGGRLENWDSVKLNVDLFEPPQSAARTIQPLKSGPNSLASVAFHVTDAAQLSKTLEGFSGEYNDALIEAHLQAFRAGEPILSHTAIDQTLPNGERCIRRYRRVLAPVVNEAGKKLIMNFSQDLRV
ncbi:hypothetical protein [Salipiger bermudensis]|uniref:hypothetical protein n=1 Tax=Salipiger bermudensis TaxID=344736 RepID=UPI001CD23097|nr:hypothetical protein [Salipiger bermudensis]MCA0963304.1 hypothetical protein [Salipiger bermudensis]